MDYTPSPIAVTDTSGDHLRARGRHRAQSRRLGRRTVSDEHLDDTGARLTAAAQPDTDREAEARQIQERIRQLDQELESYRAIVRTEPEAASAMGKWIAEANQERHRLDALLGRTPTTRLTTYDVKALVACLQAITATLAAADPADKARVHAEMGIDITYHQDGRVVVESRPRVVESGVGEALRWRTTRAALVATFAV